MYALPNKTQHKIIVKVRGGISQKLDNLTSSNSSSSASNSSEFTSNTVGKNLNRSASPLPTTGLRPLDKERILRRHYDEAGFSAELNNSPQPVFYSISHGYKQKSSSQLKAQRQYISPEHNEMIKYVQQSWKGVERDYKKSVNNYINNIDLNNSLSDSTSSAQKQNAKKKSSKSSSTPLLLSGTYHHTSSIQKNSNTGRQDSFKPFNLEEFWGNRILKRLTEEL